MILIGGSRLALLVPDHCGVWVGGAPQLPIDRAPAAAGVLVFFWLLLLKLTHLAPNHHLDD